MDSDGEWLTNAEVSASVGSAVVVAVTLPEIINTGVFPWLPVLSSDQTVLAPEAFCEPRPIHFGLRVEYFGFRASAVGLAELVAQLNPEWRSTCVGACPDLKPLLVRVAVRA
jgi:hypothetical protein